MVNRARLKGGLQYIDSSTTPAFRCKSRALNSQALRQILLALADLISARSCVECHAIVPDLFKNYSLVLSIATV